MDYIDAWEILFNLVEDRRTNENETTAIRVAMTVLQDVVMQRMGISVLDILKSRKPEA